MPRQWGGADLRFGSSMAEPGASWGKELSNREVVIRLLKIAWHYWGTCLLLLILQGVLLALFLAAVELTSVGIDFIHHKIRPSIQPPRWPFYFQPDATWTSTEVLVVIALLMVALGLIRGVLNFWYKMKEADLIERQVMFDLRSGTYDKLQRLNFSFFDANASGSLINRVTADTRAMGTFISMVVIQTVILFLSLLFYFGYMMSIHVTLTLACLSTIPLLYYLSSRFSKSVRDDYAKSAELADTMVLTLSESLSGISVVKGFAREDIEKEKFQAINCHVRDQKKSIFNKVSLFTPSVNFLSHINIIILLAYGGYLMSKGEFPLGQLVVFVGLLQQFAGQVQNLSNITNTVQQNLIGARRVFEILDAPIEIANQPNPLPLKKARGSIEFKNVTFGYKHAEPVLENLSFEIKPGQCVAVLGPTGAGKSTMMSLIPRFYDPQEGSVTIDGLSAKTLDLEDLRKSIGIVFQENFLFSNTIAANIAFGHPEATQGQIERAARSAIAHDFIMNLPKGYETVLGEGGLTLSGGQRQRLAIARALLLEPAILLLDDATAAIDAQTEKEILEAMDHAMKGRTTIIVAHRLSTLRRADVVFVMEHGRIVQAGRHEDLLNSEGHYQRIAELQLVDAKNLYNSAETKS
ncbi:MAG: ABC transporter ATP-binding protein [Verrucomicrobiota bacterium]|nr:ABC transporter ATP-binding protein [Verrucomicrobiota bacterium]